jgi:hypothetical protein
MGLVSRWAVGCVVALAGFSTSCGAPGQGEAEQLGSVELELTTVPTGVSCVRVTTTGVTKDVAVTSGSSSATLSLGTLAAGTMTFNASAYAQACTTAGFPTVAPAWIADPVSATLAPGVLTTLPMIFRQNNPVGVSANFVANIVSAKASGSVNAFIMQDGSVKGCGFGLSADAPISGLTNVKQVVSGSEHVCALKNDGTVWCWGYSSFGQVGPGIAVGSSSATWTPVQVPSLSGVKQLASGSHHNCALAGSETFCWGRNNFGQLGNNTTTNSATPVKVMNGTFALVGGELIAAGDSHVCVMMSGRLWCWGLNSSGQLGDGTTTNRTSSVAISAVGATTQLALGSTHSCALRADGTLRCWGGNGSGQLGIGTTTQSLVPVTVGLTGVKQIAATRDANCAVRSDSGVSCWGGNLYGQVGDGTGETKLSPVSVIGTSPAVRSISGASYTFLAVRADQSMLGWGSNSSGIHCDDGDARFLPLPVIPQ